jgi:hypothetical protein
VVAIWALSEPWAGVVGAVPATSIAAAAAPRAAVVDSRANMMRSSLSAGHRPIWILAMTRIVSVASAHCPDLLRLCPDS